MSKEEKLKHIKKLKKGDKVKAKLGDPIIGFYELEMKFECIDEKQNEYVNLKHQVRKSRFNPKGRTDIYWLHVNKLILG